MARLPDYDDFETPVTPTLVQDVSFGQTELYQSDEFNRISAKHKSKEAVRVAVLRCQPKRAWVHSVFDGDKKGSFFCYSERDTKQQIVGKPALCCQILDSDEQTKAKLVFGSTVLHYLGTDPETGRFPAGTPAVTQFEIGWMKFSRSAYRAVSMLVREDETIFDFDFVMAGRGATGIGYDYARVSNAPRYAADPAMLAAVQQAAAPYVDGSLLAKRLGKQIPLADFEQFRIKTVESADYDV